MKLSLEKASTIVDRALAKAREAKYRPMTDEGWLPDDVLRDEVATRAELTKVATPPDVSAVFDYSIIRKTYAQLKATGWQPVR